MIIHDVNYIYTKIKVFGWIELAWSSENINFDFEFFASSIVLKIRLQVTNNGSCKAEEVTFNF